MRDAEANGRAQPLKVTEASASRSQSGFNSNGARQRLAILHGAVGGEAPPNSDVTGEHTIQEKDLGAVAQNDVVGMTLEKVADDDRAAMAPALTAVPYCSGLAVSCQP